jgi:hypothetical protein
MSVALGMVWPFLLMVFLFRLAPWWYWAKWLDYREFLVRTKIAFLTRESEEIWDKSSREEHPELYQRHRQRLEAELEGLNKKADELYFRRSALEDKLRNWRP